MKDTRVKISTFIENQIPKHLRENSPLLIDFLRQYYISVESKGQVLDILENIDQYININNLTNVKYETKLINSVSFFDTTIQVESTLGFPDSYGLIKINEEIISYEFKTDTSFVNCFRGFSGIESYGDSNFEKNVVFNDSNISEHLNGDNVENLSVLFLSEFLQKIKKQILPGFENRKLNSNLNENIFIKQSKDFYSSKGTASSFEILFRCLYGEKVSVIRPSEFLIEPSKSNYLITKDIVVEAIEGNLEELKNQTIFQREDEYFSESSSTVTRVEKILRNDKEYFILSLDSGYDRDLESRGSLVGDFEIHPKTKVIGNVTFGQNYIDVDSTSGFPNSGVLIVNRSGIDFSIQYKSKTLNQFFQCENVPNIEDGLDIRLDTYAFAISPTSNEEIKFRISGVLSNLNISDNTILSDIGDTIKIISPGKILTDIRAKNWLYNIPITHNISTILDNGLVTTIDVHNFILGDNVSIESSNGNLSFNSNVIEIKNKNQIVINPPLVNINDEFSYKIRRKFSKSRFENYPEISNINSNVQNVYEKIEDKSIYVMSASIPNYFNKNLNISDRSILINGFQLNNQITFSTTHSFLTGDIVSYSYGSSTLNLNIDEGLYYVKKINNQTIRLFKSREDILLDRFILFGDDINVFNNKITPFSFVNKKLDTQKLVRRLDSPKFSLNLEKTQYGSTGILLNGVEISNYKSNDFIYYGPIENIDVSSNLENYDIINPNTIQISDPNGVGVGASAILHVTGNLKKVNILNAGFDYLSEPKINITGGNGIGYILDVNLINFTHSLDFNSENTNSLNLQDNIITFSEEHKFRNIERIVYKSNEKNSIGGLVNFSNYYLKSITSNSIKLYSTEQDALIGINTINFSSLGQGIHTIESFNKKKKISSINVINSGSNYSNKKLIVSSNNVNTKRNTIFAKNHGYKNKEIIYYNSTGVKIGGLNEKNYYIRVINTNEFNLVEIVENSDLSIDFNFVNNNVVNFENKGSGEHVFNYPQINTLVEGIIGVNTFSSENSQAKIQPIFRGKIENVFIASSGIKYGTPDIINFERQPNFNLIEGNEALLTPIILNGNIEDVLVLNGGKNYNTPPEIKINGEGTGAILTPIIENGKLKKIVVVNKGNGYKKNSTNIIVETGNLNSNTYFKCKIKSWNINEYSKLLELKALSENESLLTIPLNKEYGLQYKHIALPNDLRKLIFVSKIVENENYYISDKDNDIQDDPNLIIHSPIVGWAYDGNPIYGPYGFDTPTGGLVRKMNSGYTLSIANLQNRPSYSPGFFIEDYTFTNSGDLDIHNGRFCKTPEFPDGIYAYFCTLDEQLKPEFPYIIGNFYKSSPIKFNLDKNSNQDIFNINDNNLIRNTDPYKFLSKNSNYDYLNDPNKIKNQTSKISSVIAGNIDSIDIIFPGDNYKIGEDIIIESSDQDTGLGASAKISELLGKEVDNITTEIKNISNVQFSKNNIFNNTISIAATPHNLIDGDFITIQKYNIDDIFREEKFYRIYIIPTELTLNEDVGNQSGISYFSVDGNLDYPFIIEDDIFVVGLGKSTEEEIKILSIDLDSRRIKVLRGDNAVPHSKNDLLIEKPRKFYFDSNLDKNYKINKKYYFNPKETVGVGIGTTLSFSNPGVGITEIFIPTRSLYIKDHHLKTGDILIYNTNGGVGIKVSNNGLSDFTLNNNDFLYVAQISDNLIGLSTNKIGLSTQGNFIGIGTNTGILFFKDFGSGLNHSFTTNYDENLTRNVNSIKSTLTTNSEHFLKFKDLIDLDVRSSNTKTFILSYDFNSRNLIINKTLVQSINGNILTIVNHNFIKGQKVLFNSFNLLDSPQTNLIDGEKYYVLPLNPNQFKLSRTYFGSFNNENIVDINIQIYNPLIPGFNLEKGLFLSLINPNIKIIKNDNIVFNLSDRSLDGFDFNIFEDENYNNIFYGFDGFNVSKNGIPGTVNSNLILNIKETEIQKLYYTLTIPDKNNIFFEKLEYFNDTLNILNNNTLIIENSIYLGEKIISGIGTNYFEFSLNNIPESLNYINKTNSIIKYTTKSNNTLGPISKIKIISKGRNYKKLPIIREISTKFGKGAFLKVKTNNIGKIKKTTLEDIGFDYFSDSSLRPFSKIPEILRVNPLSIIDEIKVISFGKEYNIAPDLILLDGSTNKIINDIILDFELNNNFVSVIKNTGGINESTPTIIPINNSNGINISLIEFNSSNNCLDIFLNSSYSEIKTFPFSKVVAKLINDVEIFTTEILVDDSSSIPESSLIKIFNPEGSIIKDEVLYVKEKNGNILTVERGFFNTEIPNTPFKYQPNFYILLLEKEVLIENVKILQNSGKEYNSSEYNYNLFKIKQISPELGGETPFISVDFSNIVDNGNSFGTYDINSSFSRVVPKSYFPVFDIHLKKNLFSVGESVTSGNNFGIVEFWDSKNELLKINTSDNFQLNETITGKSSGYNAIITDIFNFESYYDVSSSSTVIRSWQDSVGFLNDDLQRIHNNEYYQYFSYSLKSIVQYNDWESTVNSLNHTSGFKKFCNLDIEIKNPDYIFENNVEIPYIGISTNQNNGTVSSLANLISFSNFNCRYDYDLVSENNGVIYYNLISDKIYFESVELLDYFNCINNKVLSIDDISSEFIVRERFNVVSKFSL